MQGFHEQRQQFWWRRTSAWNENVKTTSTLKADHVHWWNVMTLHILELQLIFWIALKVLKSSWNFFLNLSARWSWRCDLSCSLSNVMHCKGFYFSLFQTFARSDSLFCLWKTNFYVLQISWIFISLFIYKYNSIYELKKQCFLYTY